jgi:1-deoxy-D-xylulose-5-phosphate synthase
MDGPPSPIPIGVGELLRPGNDLLLIAYGTMVATALATADALASRGIRAAVINARFAKPLDERLILEWAKRVPRVATLEEAALMGGFGDGVLELFSRHDVRGLRARSFGVPDRIFDHASRDSLLRSAGLHPDVLAPELERWLRDETQETPEPLTPLATKA